MILANNKIFVGLGSNSSGNLDDWWEYDIDSNSWYQHPSFIGAPRHHPFYFGIGNMAYVGFGHGNNVNGQLNIFNDFQFLLHEFKSPKLNFIILFTTSFNFFFKKKKLNPLTFNN